MGGFPADLIGEASNLRSPLYGISLRPVREHLPRESVTAVAKWGGWSEYDEKFKEFQLPLRG
jgi:hypothetical protein